MRDDPCISLHIARPGQRPIKTDQDGTLDYDHAVAEAQGIRYDITLDSIAQDSTIFQQREDSDPWEVSCDARACR
jgi:hypothetical protein